MAKDVSDVIGAAIGNAAREAVEGLSSSRKKSGRGMSGGKALAAATAAGAGLAALAPIAGRGVSKLASGLEHPVEKAKDAGSEKLKGAGDKLKDEVGGKVKDEVKDSIPGASLLSKLGGGSDDDDSGSDSKGAPGVGKGRRMPVQQAADIGVPLSIVYNEFTQFENWPQFMHRVTSVSQQDETHIAFKTKIWGKTKEYTAEIIEQRPDERIAWRVVDGVSHTGVVTFHELAPRLTRVDVSLDFDPGSLIEKAARGMRLVKRAVRADLARFKAHVVMEEEASGEWRGKVEDGDVKSQRSSSSRGSSSGGSGSSSSRSGSSSGGSGSSSSRSCSSSGGSGSSSRRRSGSSSGRSQSASSRSRASSSNGSSGSGSRRRSGSRS
jgi:uncharacterized membrane protein